MKRNILFLLAFTSLAIALSASPTPTPSSKHALSKGEKKEQNRNSISTEQLVQSANGWSYVNGTWVHPEGYKYVNGKVLRTTARTGMAIPNPPGKLALDNAQKLTPKTASASTNTKTEAERKAEERRKNTAPTRVHQTGTNL